MQGSDLDPRYKQPQDPFSAQPQLPGGSDFSAYEDPLPDIGGSDDETIRKMNRRTSPFGRIVGTVIVAGAVGLGYWAYQSNVSYENRNAVFDQAKKLSGEAQLEVLRSGYAAAEHDDVKERILLNLGFSKDLKSVPLMISALDEAGIVRRAAARALAQIGSPGADQAKAKLLEVLPKTDASDRAQVAWACAVFKEQAAVPVILEEFTAGHLQGLEDLEGKPTFDPKVIVDAVGPERLGTDEMIKHPNKAVRTLVAVSLSEAATPETVLPLTKLLEDSDPEVVKAAAAGLGRAGDPRGTEPLFALLQRNPSLRQSVLDAVSKSTSAPGIAKLIDATDNVDLKRSLVGLLAEMHDVRVVDAFAKLLSSDDADLKQTSAEALAELGDARAVPTLLELAKSEDRTTALDALDALAKVSKPPVADALLPLLKDNPGRKASLLKAIGKSGNSAVGATLMKELEGDDVEAAAFALADLKYEPAYKKLLERIKRPKDVDFSKPSVSSEEIVRNREIAVRALGRYGKPEAIAPLSTIVADPTDSAKLRAIAGAVLGQIADERALHDIIAKAKSPALDEATRTYFVQGLWQADAQALSGQLADLLQPSVPADVRRSAALAIGYAADPANDQLLLDLLRNNEVKRDAAFAVVLGGNPAAADELYQRLSADRELREALQEYMTADDVDFFNLITARQFENGEIFRRLKVADILKNTRGENTFSFPWQQVIARLKAGWNGPGGLSAQEVRLRLYDTLRGQEPEKRRIAAEALGAMGERGLLLASRDTPGAGQEDAREVLLRQNRATLPK